MELWRSGPTRTHPSRRRRTASADRIAPEEFADQPAVEIGARFHDRFTLEAAEPAHMRLSKRMPSRAVAMERSSTIAQSPSMRMFCVESQGALRRHLCSFPESGGEEFLLGAVMAGKRMRAHDRPVHTVGDMGEEARVHPPCSRCEKECRDMLFVHAALPPERPG